MYTIKRAAELTGVPAATLRAWERRYDVVGEAPFPHLRGDVLDELAAPVHDAPSGAPEPATLRRAVAYLEEHAAGDVDVADVAAAAEGIAAAGFFNAGQDCTAATRAIVAAEHFEAFTDRVAELMDGVRLHMLRVVPHQLGGEAQPLQPAGHPPGRPGAGRLEGRQMSQGGAAQSTGMSVG